MATLDANDYVSYEWTDGSSPYARPVKQSLTFRLVQHGRWGELTRGGDLPIAILQRDPSVEFALACKLWRWTPLKGPDQPGDPIKVFTCKTDGTRIIPGQLFTKDDVAVPPLSLVGPFIESVNVRMGFGPGVPALLVKRGPDTDEEVGDVSSTLSYGFNFGFFGEELTGGVSADYSNTSSMQLKDYRIRSDSDEAVTNHTISLAMLEGGEPYTHWMATPQNPQLPPRATSDMELAVQGLWELPGELTDEVVFTVEVTVTFQTLPDSWEGFRLLPETTYRRSPERGQWGMSTGVVLGQPAQPAYPEGDTHWEKTLKWSQQIKVPLALADTPASDDGDVD